MCMQMIFINKIKFGSFEVGHLKRSLTIESTVFSFTFLNFCRYRFYTSQPHIAGSKHQHDLALHLADKWRTYGFDKVEMPEYKVLLSLPQEDKPNKVELIGNGTTHFAILGKVKVRWVSCYNVQCNYNILC